MDSPMVVHGHTDTNLLKWYHEECTAKCLASMIWSVGVYQVAVIGFVCLANLSLWYPLQWITDSSSYIFSFQLIFSSILIQVLCCLSTLLYFKFITGQVKTFCKQGDIFTHLLETKQLVKILIRIVLSVTLTFIFKKFSYYTISDDGHVFLLLLSIFMGLYYSANSEVEQKHVIMFPVINQKRFYRMKKMIQSSLYSSVPASLNILRFYYVIFVVFICIPRSIVTFLSNPSLASASSILSILYTLCNIQLFWLSLCLTVSTVFMFNITFQMLQLYYTEHVQFPLNGENCLSKAICSDNYMLKVQAVYDLCQLSKAQSQRRSQIFMLTQPGSQAHTWNVVCLEGLRLMEGTKSLLQYEVDSKQHNVTSHTQNPSDVNTIGNQHLLSPDKNLRRRNIQEPSEKSIDQSNILAKNDLSKENQRNFANNIPILYLYIEALCNLVSASMKEDRYGVVQIKLGEILSSMFDLLETCETFAKMSLSPLHHFVSMGDQSNQQYLHHVSSLKIALKTAVYRITTKFGHHLNALRLPKEHQKRLQGFIEMVD